MTPVLKRVTVTIDFEGNWGMPHRAAHDLCDTTNRLLTLLDQFSAKAVFFATGKLVEDYPKVIEDIHHRGHEIGLHGYVHEHMHDLNIVQIDELFAQLRGSADRLERMTGYWPTGFRAPFLMGPVFYDSVIYDSLARDGFTWVSNREIRWPEELARPDRLPSTEALWRSRSLRHVGLVLLNLKLLATENPNQTERRILPALEWILQGQPPFTRPQGLVEYPLYSPFDCDLLGLPLPHAPSGNRLVDYASRVYRNGLDRCEGYFNLNFHDWIIGTADRLEILQRTLAYIATRRDMEYFLPGLEQMLAGTPAYAVG